LYLGGGTPSLVAAEEVSTLVEGLRRRFSFDRDTEVTLEANPEDVTAERRDAWRSSGVNRVSLGVQSLEDAELAAVGRRHDADGARRAIDSLATADLSLSADLILGLPEQTTTTFRENVARIAAAGVEHVSIYLLETEKSRVLEADRRARPGRYLSDDDQAEAWMEAGHLLAAQGFRHYEISNWAHPGREARHNVKYWTRTPTLGLGVSAHELWGERRRANVSQIPQYVSALTEGRRPLAIDRPVGYEEADRERIMLGLRLSAGIPASEIETWVAESGDPLLSPDYDSWLEAGILEREQDRVHFTERGFLVSNEVLCRFV
jgi:oxygen-independent coproporphyrinogen-3 oxidase